MINPELYYALVRAFGHASVEIKNEDEGMTPQYERQIGIDGTLKYRLNKASSGEEYRLNCPFCNDTRMRLYINHRWGFYDSNTQSRNLWLAHCWNEECLSDYDNRMLLYDMVYGNRKVSRELLLRPEKSGKSKEVPKPGVLLTLEQLIKKAPGHIAIRYLRDRWYDPIYLSKRFNVTYCVDSELVHACGRIIAPFIENQQVIGWQARYVGTPDNKRIAKWYTAPNFSVSKHPYNFEKAVRHGTLVIVEGPGDVWSFGPQAMGLCGKTLSRNTVERIKAEFRGSAIIVMLDPKLAPDHKVGHPHHIEAAVTALRSIERFRDCVIPVYLPEHLDPGSTDRSYMQQLVYYWAKQQSIEINFNEVDTPPPSVEGRARSTKVLHHLLEADTKCLRLSTR